MIERAFFSDEHHIFRDSVRRWVQEELVPHHADWETAGIVPREVWARAGELGMLCCNISEDYGGPGADWLYNVIMIEEMARGGITGPGFGVHSDMVAPYIAAFGSEELRQTWLPRMVAGTTIGALGITEPGAGSDVRGLRTVAVRDGDDFVINGQKVYISNGQLADIVVLACRTAMPNSTGTRISLILVETNTPGFTRGRNLEKIGYKAQDTSELFFSDVRVPASNMIGALGQGFQMMMTKLAQERLSQAVRSVQVAECAIDWTVTYTKERKAFGHTLADFQNTQFKLAELSAHVTAQRVFTDYCITEFMAGRLDGVMAAKAKLLTTDLHCKVVDECLQFFGGYGYMSEYPIARAYIDSRITRIAGGASEVMKQIIGRNLFGIA